MNGDTPPPPENRRQRYQFYSRVLILRIASKLDHAYHVNAESRKKAAATAAARLLHPQVNSRGPGLSHTHTHTPRLLFDLGQPAVRRFRHLELELELELIQPHMAQKPMLRGEVGCACVAREVRVERRGLGERVLSLGLRLSLANLVLDAERAHLRSSCRSASTATATSSPDRASTHGPPPQAAACPLPEPTRTRSRV